MTCTRPSWFKVPIRRTSLAITFVLCAGAIAFLLSRRGVELALVGITAVRAPRPGRRDLGPDPWRGGR